MKQVIRVVMTIIAAMVVGVSAPCAFADRMQTSKPESGDCTKEQAISISRNAILQFFSVDEETLDSMPIETIFAIQSPNDFQAPTDEPIWIVEFGDGFSYRVVMTRIGQVIGLMAPMTQYVTWGRTTLDDVHEATPGLFDATLEQAITNATIGLLEVHNISHSDLANMATTGVFIYSDLYAHGTEPVWIVTFSEKGTLCWQVLLGYDGTYIDSEPAGKMFDQVIRQEKSLPDLCKDLYAPAGLPDPVTGESYYFWSLEEKKNYYDVFSNFVNAYAASHPYFNGNDCDEWLFTRNISSMPDEKAISQDTAWNLAVQALAEEEILQCDSHNFGVFYYVSDPSHPEWRFASASCGVSIDAYSGEILLIDTEHNNDNYAIYLFVSDVKNQE